jgi:UDP-N-acetyl-D-galactosamine dehydrogenase
MSIYNDIVAGRTKIAVIGLGYVGMPLAIAFAKRVGVVGFDISEKKISLYRSGIDPTHEVGDQLIKNSNVSFTSEEKELSTAKFHIIAVPTPINPDKTPDLTPVVEASRIVGRHVTRGSFVVYESTVYPGVTEDICLPILEKESGLKNGIDFWIGYSPERINPGDKVHRLDNITKIVSGQDDKTLDEIAKVYELIIEAGVFKASSIKVAEAAKVVENSQRDINIAFMNETAMVFERMGIDTKDVIDAMNTKWNALRFYPGLVGGHCIGVDPYYFIYQAEQLGYHSQIINSGRRINDGMDNFIVQIVIKKLIQANKQVKQSKVFILGCTFKENTPDTRNSRVFSIMKGLEEYGIKPIVIDPVANKEEAKQVYGVEIRDVDSISNADCLLIAVAHDVFRQMPWAQYESFFKPCKNEEKVLIDVKGILDREMTQIGKYSYWRL